MTDLKIEAGKSAQRRYANVFLTPDGTLEVRTYKTRGAARRDRGPGLVGWMKDLGASLPSQGLDGEGSE